MGGKNKFKVCVGGAYSSYGAEFSCPERTEGRDRERWDAGLTKNRRKKMLSLKKRGSLEKWSIRGRAVKTFVPVMNQRKGEWDNRERGKGGKPLKSNILVAKRLFHEEEGMYLECQVQQTKGQKRAT